MNHPRSSAVRLAIGWVTLFLIGTDLFVVSPLLPPIAHQFTQTPATAGWMVSIFSIMYAIGAPWLGAWSDKVGRRPVIVMGLVGFAIANALTSVAPNFLVLLVSRMLAGISAAAVTPTIYAVTGDVAPFDQRGKWLAIVGSGLLMALWAGAPIGTMLAQVVGWQGVFRTLAAISGIVLVGNAAVWPSRAARTATHPQQMDGKSFRAVIGGVMITTFWGAAVYGFYTYLGTGLRLFDHFSAGMLATSIVIYGVGATLGSLLGGRLADRWGAGQVASASLLGLGLLLVIIGMGFDFGPWLDPFFFLLSLAGYAFFPSYQARLAQDFPERRGYAMAWNNSALYIGIGIGSVFGGWIIRAMPFPALPVMCGVIAIGGAAVSYGRIKQGAKRITKQNATPR